MKKVVGFSVALLALFLAVRNWPTDVDRKQISTGNTTHVAEVASTISNGVGDVRGTFAGGSKAPVYIFEEYHTSKVGQIETAIMLLRLRQFGIKLIGLEGWTQPHRVLNAGWFHTAGGGGLRTVREDTAVRMMGEGEISSSEALALIFPDEEVYGIEDGDLYNREFDTKLDAASGYLVSIAEKGATEDLLRRVDQLIDGGKRDEGIDLLISSDPWTRERYKEVKAETEDISRSISCESMIKEMRELEDRAAQMSVDISSELRRAADATVGFYEACEGRSKTMVDRTLEIASNGTGGSVAIIIGAAHTEGITQMLRDRNTSFAVIRPVAFNPKYGSLSGPQFERKNTVKWSRVEPGTLGLLLNAPGITQGAPGVRKPPPIIETTTAKSYASAEMAAMVIANAARERKRVPEDIWDQIQGLPEFRADRESFRVIGDDVVYKTTLKKTDGTDTAVWARVGTADTVAEAKDLEQKLLQARVDLGGKGNIPPTKPPANTTATNDEGPGDGRRGKMVISRTGPRSLAVFASSKSDVLNVGKVSG